MNFADMLDKNAHCFPDRPAIIEGDITISFSQLHQDVNKAASAMVKLGLQLDDHVALCAPNAYAWVVIYYAAIKAGAVAVTFSYLLKKGELTKILADCRPKILFTSDDKLSDMGDQRDESHLSIVVCNNGDISFPSLLEKGDRQFPTVNRHRDDTAAILYTGGTTGTPKGAMLSHQNLKSSIFNIAHYERCTMDDRALCFLPLNHVFGQVHIMNSTIYSCGATILQPAFDMDQVLNALTKYKITKFYAVPTIYIRLLGLPDLKETFKSIRYCFSAAASMALEVVQAWKEKTGLDIYESYGMTESAAMVTYNHFYRHKVGSVGTVVNIVEVEIRDDGGNALPQGEKGEICVCGPNITKGYLNHPEETRDAFWGDWYRTGDIGIFDEEGYLFIVDRLKDMIITGGENVYSREVEEVLYTHPKVFECAVVGLPDAEYGERVTAYIIPQPGQHIDSVVLKAYMKERLASYKVPKAFIEVDELPKSSAGKLVKREIRNTYTAPKP
ncbi:class I adenylate-forming enzyme family protein [Desulfosarcina ovata]|uniref:Long-chain fatty acid--CoA ligase n=1 Tax=Desulfosarcina ovata subsp. ovata TaxID=2752305 RepID=A0A5K8ANC2_9BACT|nr:AMP-binding protein [Desulfosarcina ovata]BBO93370.1 long-chain fatty acid--CoA ligase [Desulfosarcina ovata subsp. ovata]